MVFVIRVPFPARRIRPSPARAGDGHRGICSARDLRQPGIGIGRDRSRTPMPWDDTPFAGFSTTEPWLPLNPDWRTRNVSAQRHDPAAMLQLYRNLLRLRGAHPPLSIGTMTLVDAPDGILAYERTHHGERLHIILNLTPHDAAVDWHGTPLLSTREGAPEPGLLRANEGLILA